MNIDLDRLLRLVTGALEGAAREDAEFRAGLLEAARSLVSRLEIEKREGPTTLSPALATQTVARPISDPLLNHADAQLADATLRLGGVSTGLRVRANSRDDPVRDTLPMRGPTIVEPPPGAYENFALEADFELMARRCALKAQALRWQIERGRLLNDGEFEQVSTRDRAMIDAARNEPDCFLWMCRPDYHSIHSNEQFEEAACCYEALAEAGTLLAEADRAAEGERTETVAEAMRLLGEAQSALRVVADHASLTRDDPDQIMAFSWLRRETAERGVYVQHLQYQSPANPADHRELRRRISEAHQQLRLRETEAGKRRALFKKAAYHAARVSNGGGDESDWKKVSVAVEELISTCGVPSSDRELRDLLLPLMDDLPADDLGPGMRDAVGSVDQYLQQLATRQDGETRRRSESPSLLQARMLLSGRSAVMVGGQARELHRRTIEASLHLDRLEWIGVQHHQSLEGEVHAAIRRPEVSVVITMTRFRSHQFGPQIRAWCRDYGKMFIELPGGYGVEQIAHQVVRQAGQELRVSDQTTAAESPRL